MNAPLNDEQFSPHGLGYYQRPLPGMEMMGADKELPVHTLFHRSTEIDHPIHEGEQYWFLTRNYHPETVRVRTSSLRPTQPHVDEEYLHDPAKYGSERFRAQRQRENKETPVIYRDNRGKNLVMDGHHRVARALLNDKKTMLVRRYHPGMLG
jgi:hypothetical protein